MLMACARIPNLVRKLGRNQTRATNCNRSEFLENGLVDWLVNFDAVDLRAFEFFSCLEIDLDRGKGELNRSNFPEVRAALLDRGRGWIDIDMQRAHIAAARDEPALRIDIKRRGIAVV